MGKTYNFLAIIAILMFVFLVLAIANGIIRTNDAALKLKEDCPPTEMYVIGNKGHIGRVYDCSKVDND